MTTSAAILIALQALAGADASADAKEASSDIAGATPTTNERRSDAAPAQREDQRWIDRWAPEKNTGELGIYGGVFLPGDRLELFEPDPDQADQGFESYDPVATALGGRVGYYPSRFFGLEAEGGAMLAQTADGERATLWTARGNLVAQLGLWSVTPFVAAGGGALAVSSDAVGSDVDAAVHVGGGLKMFLSRRTQIRLDLRDVMGSARGLGNGENHNFEATLGLGLTLGRKDKEPVYVPPSATPEPKDSDADGVIDPDDACVNEWGDQPNGCPIGDADGDGVKDDIDACVNTPGEPADGCPIIDTDGDGFMDPDDKCVTEPETVNSFEDTDGCPDEVPDEVKAFDGVIEGIFFDSSKASIKSKSQPKLDEVVDILKRHPDLRLHITGHTDDRGKRAFNQSLSEDRAAAVRDYLVSHGIDASRLTTEGKGPDAPRASNKSKQGRADNRRIEFKRLP